MIAASLPVPDLIVPAVVPRERRDISKVADYSPRQWAKSATTFRRNPGFFTTRNPHLARQSRRGGFPPSRLRLSPTNFAAGARRPALFSCVFESPAELGKGHTELLIFGRLDFSFHFCGRK